MLKHVTAESLEMKCGSGLAEVEHLQISKKLTIHGGMGDMDFAGSAEKEIRLDGCTGNISLTIPETAAEYDISDSFFNRNVKANGKTLKSEVSMEQNGGDLDSLEMDFDEDVPCPNRKHRGKSKST